MVEKATHEPLREYLEFAVETATLAGRLTLGYFQTGVLPDFKADDTPVTVADRNAEAFIRQRIEARYPRHALLGEEYGSAGATEASHRWIIDPIDGTKSFVRGVPLYAVLLALEIDGRCEVGVACFPALGEVVYAATGEGCFWNGRRARVSEAKALDRSVVSFTDPKSFATYGRADAWQRVQDACYYRVGWSDAYGHALVATGRVEVMLDPIMNPWDCAPFIPILHEAGGYCGDWSGTATIYGGEALSTTQALLPEVLALLEGRGDERAI